MREIVINEKKQRVVASPLTLFIYKKEFKKDIMGDLLSFQNLESNAENYDGMIVLQVLWAILKTAEPFSVPCFEKWVSELEHFFFDDTELIGEILGEAFEGFFRGAV